MLTRFCLLGLVVIAMNASRADEEKSTADLKKFQGQWVLHALEINGKEAAPDQISNTVLSVEGDTYEVTVREKKLPCKIRLDASKDPKAIDMTFREQGNVDKTYKGIYRFKDDTFQVCRNIDASKPRPDQFGSWPDTGVFLVTWKKK